MYNAKHCILRQWYQRLANQIKNTSVSRKLHLIIFSMGLFPLLKICHTYLTMMKFAAVTLYLNKIQKIFKSHDT